MWLEECRDKTLPGVVQSGSRLPGVEVPPFAGVVPLRGVKAGRAVNTLSEAQLTVILCCD